MRPDEITKNIKEKLKEVNKGEKDYFVKNVAIIPKSHCVIIAAEYYVKLISSGYLFNHAFIFAAFKSNVIYPQGINAPEIKEIFEILELT